MYRKRPEPMFRSLPEIPTVPSKALTPSLSSLLRTALSSFAYHRSQVERTALALERVLYTYQIHDVIMMITRFVNSGRGSINANDMGTGKTLEELALMLCVILLRKQKCLLVGPTPIFAEISKLVELFEVSDIVKAVDYNTLSDQSRLSEIWDHDIVMMTYMRLGYEWKAWHSGQRSHVFSDGCRWGAAILDEGDSIRNENAQCSKGALALISQIPMRFSFSGTPFNNFPSDLIPALYFTGNITTEERTKLRSDLTSRVMKIQMEAVTSLRNIFIASRIHRTHDPVTMPSFKIESVGSPFLNSSEAELYQRFMKATRDSLRDWNAQIEGSSSDQVSGNFFNALAVCSYAPHVEGIEAKDYRGPQLTKIQMLDKIVRSDLLPFPDVKMVVFSRFKFTLDAVRLYFEELGISVVMYTGDVSRQNREIAVNQFNGDSVESPRVILSTTRAGGTSLSLVRGSVVVLMESGANPKADGDQPRGRIFRITQKRACRGYQLFIQGTSEERIMGKCEVKNAVCSFLFSDPLSMTLDQLEARILKTTSFTAAEVRAFVSSIIACQSITSYRNIQNIAEESRAEIRRRGEDSNSSCDLKRPTAKRRRVSNTGRQKNSTMAASHLQQLNNFLCGTVATPSQIASQAPLQVVPDFFAEMVFSEMGPCFV